MTTRFPFMRAAALAGALLGGLVPAAGPVLGLAPAALAASCQPAGPTGLTAAVVATAGQTIGGTVDATGCDIGVYVGAGAEGTVINGATITGANNQGILVQDTRNVTIEHSTIKGNGLHPTKGLPEDKGVQLIGTAASLVLDNVVTGNRADGGIAINDDGPVSPGGLHAGMTLPGIGNQVIGNTVSGNLNGCGIVLSSYNAGGAAGVRDNLVQGNTITGTPGVFPPTVGGVVVAADVPDSIVTSNTVESNTITGNLLPGVVVHSNAPGDIVAGTVIRWNTISANDWATPEGPSKPAGIILIGEVEPVYDTFIEGNQISAQYFGVWARHAVNLFTQDMGGNNATVPELRLP